MNHPVYVSSIEIKVNKRNPNIITVTPSPVEGGKFWMFRPELMQAMRDANAALGTPFSERK